MKLRTIIYFFIVNSFATILLPAQISTIYINEFLASNTSTIKSPVFSEYADWLELKNSTAAGIDLDGYYLTDDLSNPTKWKIPVNTILPANGYLIFWADDRNIDLHTNFKLSRDGEAIGLFSASGEVIDTISFGYQYDNISYGRLLDNPFEWSFFNPPTPSTKNSSSTDIGIAPAPQFSLAGGFYLGKQLLSISVSDTSTRIRYTLNGTPPDSLSNLYALPISIDSTIAVRVRTFKNGKVPSAILTNTYFINEPSHLPVISLVTDPANFFDNKIGIYVTGTNGKKGDCDPTIRNLNQDWERPVNIEFYETTGVVRMNQGAGVKIFGGCSRTRYPQKSLALFARSEYGKGSFGYQFFPNKPIYEFESILLRSSSDDQVYTMFRDALAHTSLWLGMNADGQAYRPVVVFLNGVYWGIHNIREKVNEHYFKENFNVEEDNLNILERDPYNSFNTVFGSAASYNAMMNYIKSHSLTNDVYYNYIKTQMDVDQFINYMIGHIYLAERDWPGNNIRFWKANTGKYSKWRWINYDMDQTFTHIMDDNISVATAVNGPNWPNPPWSTLLLRNLLINKNFKNEFIQRYAYFLSTIFMSENQINIIDSLKGVIAPEIPRHIKKWGGKTDPDFHENWTVPPTFNSVYEWQSNVQVMRTFATLRPQYARLHIINKFGLGGTSQLSTGENISGAGKLKINGFSIPDSGYSAPYFKTVPFILGAVPVFGYRFLYWKTGTTTIPSQKTEITLTHDSTFIAYYEKVSGDSNLVVINEINYHSSAIFDPGDWIELYNRRNQSIDISGWHLKDENNENSFTIPDGTEIQANGYLVLCNNISAFQKLFPNTANSIGNFVFGFKSTGDIVRLYSDENIFVDSVRYGNTSPWPATPDGGGASLELKNPWYNNDSASNWSASLQHGTPGSVNSTITDVAVEYNTPPKNFELFQNNPNPFNPSTNIRYQIPQSGFVELKVYDILGKQVAILVGKVQNAGYYNTSFDASNLSSGVYLYRLQSGNFSKIQKMVLIK